MACIAGRTCPVTLDSLALDLQHKGILGYYEDPVLTHIVSKLYPPNEWREVDIPLLQSIKNGGPVLDKDFNRSNSPLGNHFKKIAEYMKLGKKGYDGKILFEALVAGSKSRRFKKRRNKSRKRRR